jgi:hypothetical protein
VTPALNLSGQVQERNKGVRASERDRGRGQASRWGQAAVAPARPCSVTNDAAVSIVVSGVSMLDT